IEVRLVDRQPWQLWPFLKGAPRLEVLYHSIHYLDAIRFLFGEPDGVCCKAITHPDMSEFRDTRSTIILDYGNRIRCSLTLNHTHRNNGKHQASEFKIEGSAGSALHGETHSPCEYCHLRRCLSTPPASRIVVQRTMRVAYPYPLVIRSARRLSTHQK